MKNIIPALFFIITISLCQAQTSIPILWGMTNQGGDGRIGNIFNLSANGFNNDYSFCYVSACAPSYNIIQANNGLLYGIDGGGGAANSGAIFSYDISSGTLDDLHDFGVGNDGAHPAGSLIQASNGLLYGITSSGGADSNGTIYSYNISTGVETDVYDFKSMSDAQQPTGSLLQASNGILYGVSNSYMDSNFDNLYGGAIFSYDIATGVENVLYIFKVFSWDGNYVNPLIQANNGLLYGVIMSSGAYDDGDIFSYNIDSGTEKDVYDFQGNGDGAYPNGSLLQASNGLLYGTTFYGGETNSGVLFGYNIYKGMEMEYDFGSTIDDGINPAGALTEAKNGLLYGMTTNGGTLEEGTIFNYNISTNTETVIHNFGYNDDGSYPYSSLIQASNGLLYGPVDYGGTNNDGIIFSYNISSDTEINLFSFGGPYGGENPIGSLLKASNGLLYGVTEEGGSSYPYYAGILFSYDITTGTQTPLHDFGNDTDGAGPCGTLIQASDGLLYGMTSAGGTVGNGTIFNYNIATGVETDVHDFGYDYDGNYPYGSLIQASNGLLYGMTSSGGTNYYAGVIFSYNIASGQETILHYFGNNTDGSSPRGSLFQASNGLLYGMTESGGINGSGTIFNYDISTGTETPLYNFGGYYDGAGPAASLITAKDGLFYGLTTSGGTNNEGVIFSYDTSSGIETGLYNFGNGNDGANPNGDLIQASNGLLYGMTHNGGAFSDGIIFNYNINTGTENDIKDFNGINGSSPYGSLIEDDDIEINSNNTDGFIVYPNPNQGQFTIQLNDVQNNYTMDIYNVLGEKVYQSIIVNTQSTINLIGLAKGMYFIYLISGNDTKIGKVIIAK